MKKIDLVEAVAELAKEELSQEAYHYPKLYKAVINGGEAFGVEAATNFVKDVQAGELKKVANRVSKSDLENILEWAKEIYEVEEVNTGNTPTRFDYAFAGALMEVVEEVKARQAAKQKEESEVKKATKLDKVNAIVELLGWEEISHGGLSNETWHCVNQGTLKLWGYDKINNFCWNLKLFKEKAAAAATSGELDAIILVIKQRKAERDADETAALAAMNSEGIVTVTEEAELDVKAYIKTCIKHGQTMAQVVEKLEAMEIAPEKIEEGQQAYYAAQQPKTKEETEMTGKTMQERTEERIEYFLKGNKIEFDQTGDDDTNFVITYGHMVGLMFANEEGDTVLELSVELESGTKELAWNVFTHVSDVLPVMVAKNKEAETLIKESAATQKKEELEIAEELNHYYQTGQMVVFANSMAKVNEMPLRKKMAIMSNLEPLMKGEVDIEKEIENHQFLLENFAASIDDGFQIEDEEILVGGRGGKEYDIHLYTFSYFSLDCELNYNPDDKQYHLQVKRLDKADKIVTNSTYSLKQFIKKALDTL